MADLLTDQDIDSYVAAAADVALPFVGISDDVMLGTLYQVRADMEAKLAQTLPA